MTIPNHAGAIAYALRRLHDELPEWLTYHNLYHTEKDVMPAVERLAELCLVDEEGIRLLQIAAAYHDIGFIHTYAGHESEGVRMITEVLPDFGYSSDQIDRIGSLILATRLPQSPANLLEAILTDADLDVLGRPDFWARSQDLYQEISARGEPIDQLSWLEQQRGFLLGHTYFTPEARTLRDVGKQKNIALVEEMLRVKKK